MANDTELVEHSIVPSPKGDRHSLSRLIYDGASEILGLWLTPDGDITNIVAGLK